MPTSARALLVLCALVVVCLMGSHHRPDDDLDLASVAGAATIWRRYRRYLVLDCERRPRTVSAYRWVFWSWVEFLGDKPWHRATAKDLQRYLERPPRSGRAAGGRLGANTRLHYSACLTSFYAWAHVSGHLRKNPMAGVKLPKGGIPIPRSFPLVELSDILAAAERSDDRLYAACLLAYTQGLRAAEIAGLKIEDVHLDEQPRLLVHGKGGKLRILPLHPEMRAVIVRMLAERGFPRVGALVTSRRFPGEPMTPGSVSRMLSDHIRKRCEIDGSGHSLRHSFALRLLEAEEGRNLEQVRQALGHESDRTTRIYISSYNWDLVDQIPKVPVPHRRPRN